MITDKQIDRLFTYEDNDGNFFLCRNRYIVLSLKSESRQRNIGKIVCDNDELVYSKYENIKDIYRMTNAWSIPYFIVKRVDRITFYTKTHFYRISSFDIITAYEADILHFKNSGIELKVYVPLSMWTITERK